MNQRIEPMSTFTRYWNGPTAQRAVGIEHVLRTDRPVKAFVKNASGSIVLRDVESYQIVYTVDQQSWLGRFQPEACRGLIDYLDERAFTASYLPISEVPGRRDSSWQSIEDPASVAVKIRGTVVTTTRIILIDNLTSEPLGVTLVQADDSD
jgi:hypothetical protein